MRLDRVILALLFIFLSSPKMASPGNGKREWTSEMREMTVTAYCPGPCKICGTTGVTATGKNAKLAGVAVDPEAIPLGRAFLDIPGADTGPNANGSWLPADDTGKDVKKDLVDLRLPTHKQAKEWGRQKLKVRIWTRGTR